MYISDPDKVKSTINDFRRGTIKDCNHGLVIDYGRANCRILNALDLASLVQHFPGRLALISLANVRVVDNASSLIRSLASCRFLKSFELHLSLLEQVEMADLGRALAQLPLLETFSVRGGEAPFFQAATPVLQSPNHVLNTVSLTQFSTFHNHDDADDNSFQAEEASQELENFFEAAAASKSLKSLVFCPYSQQGTLQSLQSAPQQQELLVAKLIQQSSTLGSLTLCLHPRTDLRSVAAALRHNTRLEELVIQRAWALVPPIVPEQEARAFHVTLQNYNTTLQKLRVTSLQRTSNRTCRVHWDATAFYLTLNRMGRKRLVGTSKPASTSDWIRAISFQEDPSIVYWFLRRNPVLCQGGEVSHSNATVDRYPLLKQAPTKKRKREAGSSQLGATQGKKKLRSMESGLLNALTYTAVFAAGYWIRGSS